MINPYVVAIVFAVVIYVLGVVLGLGMVYVGLITQRDGDPFDVEPEEED